MVNSGIWVFYEIYLMHPSEIWKLSGPFGINIISFMFGMNQVTNNMWFTYM